MNRIDVAIVRFLPFVLYILIGVCTTMIICGEDVGEFYLIHGNSAIYAARYPTSGIIASGIAQCTYSLS